MNMSIKNDQQYTTSKYKSTVLFIYIYIYITVDGIKFTLYTCLCSMKIDMHVHSESLNEHTFLLLFWVYTLFSFFSLKVLNVQPIATMSSVAVPVLPLALTLMLPPNANAPVCRPAPVRQALFWAEVGVYTLPGVVVPIRVTTSLLGSHSGLTKAVVYGVNAKREANAWSVSIKTVGQGGSARWLRA